MTEPVLALVSVKLIKNWQVKWAKFLDTDDLKLNLKIYIKYKSAIVNKRIGMSKKKEMMILKRTESTNNAFRYLIIILPTS